MSEGSRTYGASHGKWSSIKALQGLRAAQSPEIVSEFIKEKQLRNEIKDRLTGNVMRRIVLSYGVSISHYDKRQYTYELRIDEILFKLKSFDFARLVDIGEVLVNKGIHECLKSINNDRDLIPPYMRK